MSERAPCVRCGMILHTGEGRVLVAFTPNELEQLALATMDRTVSDRLLCALGLLDPDREQAARADRAVTPELKGDTVQLVCSCAAGRMLASTYVPRARQAGTHG